MVAIAAPASIMIYELRITGKAPTEAEGTGRLVLYRLSLRAQMIGLGGAIPAVP